MLVSKGLVALPRIAAALFGFSLECVVAPSPARNLRLHTLSPFCCEQNSANPAVRARSENCELDIIRALIVANTFRDKFARLAVASVELDELRILVRLAKDLRFTNMKQYQVAAG